MSTRAVSAVALVLALAPKMPEQCNKVLGKAAPAASASAEPAPTTPPPPPPPSNVPTAPPIWTPPEAATPAPPAAPSSEELMTAARAAADKKDWKKAKAILDKRVRSGHATGDEVDLMRDACVHTRDKACLEALKKLYPPEEE